MPSRYVLSTSQLFLTFPQCPAPKEDVLAFFMAALSNYGLTNYIVAHELHANGDPHIHCYFKLDRKYHTTSSTALDLILGPDVYHGNYQGCRSAKAVKKYCSKAEDYLSNMDLATELAAKHTRAALAKKILDGASLEELVHEAPQLLFGYRNHCLDVKLFKEATLKPAPIPQFIPNTWGKLLSYNPTSKCRHYWIWSSQPNKGKTTFAKSLKKSHNAVIQAGDFSYWNVDPSLSILILDDYNHASLKFHQLNQLGDNTFGFRRFHAGVLTMDEYLVIVLSNFDIKTLYPFKYDTLYARFIEIEL